jgi:hypothetical protein
MTEFTNSTRHIVELLPVRNQMRRQLQMRALYWAIVILTVIFAFFLIWFSATNAENSARKDFQTLETTLQEVNRMESVLPALYDQLYQAHRERSINISEIEEKIQLLGRSNWSEILTAIAGPGNTPVRLTVIELQNSGDGAVTRIDIRGIGADNESIGNYVEQVLSEPAIEDFVLERSAPVGNTISEEVQYEFHATGVIR